MLLIRQLSGVYINGRIKIISCHINGSPLDLLNTWEDKYSSSSNH